MAPFILYNFLHFVIIKNILKSVFELKIKLCRLLLRCDEQEQLDLMILHLSIFDSVHTELL